ncbi:hypothetical protein [Cohaesibacter celericrescens]|uniref:hypothetical protein n=1 Tax=Cohaesibacter celericrescens TaxID=2067669 RepID=UPI0011AF29D0|nr:hypothetical protein [Cohaesibacter celericrescens]
MHIVNPEAFCDGWAFFVPLPAFNDALDLSVSTWKVRRQDRNTGRDVIDPKTNKPITDTIELMTQGKRPDWAFSVGDLVHSSRSLACEPWPKNPKGHSLVVEAVDGGELIIKHHDWSSGVVERLRFTQEGFVGVLRNGLGEVKNMDEITFEVEGSKGDSYFVTVEMSEGKFSMRCTCAAGAYGGMCRHRLDLLSGEVGNVLSSNESDLDVVLGAFSKTKFPKHIEEIAKAATEKARWAKRERDLKKQLGREMDKGMY